MSRLKNFTHSVVSGYLLLGVTVFYTMASVPLTLHYLSKAEFGLWALVLQVGNFIAMVDLGMSISIGRILIDHKDDRSTGRYGGAIQSGFLVGVVQGVIVLVVGLGLVCFLPAWLHVTPDLSGKFFWLMTGQVLLTAAGFGTRMLGQVLYAWQRVDISNYCAMSQLLVGFATLWIGYVFGWGIFSLLAGALVSWICGSGLNAFFCSKLGFWPKAGEWGRASSGQFRELFHYGAEVFLVSIGSQLILSSQTVLISRQLGVESGALWSVMTKMFTLVTGILWRIVSSAMPSFAEMQVRGESGLLWSRFRTLFITTSVLAGMCAVLFAACNAPFVALWTNVRFSWSPFDNVLLGVWLVVLTQQCCHNSLILNLKEVRSLKYIIMAEGILFVIVGLAILPAFGITGMLLCSVLGTTLFTWLSGSWRIAQLSKMGWKPLVWDWQKPLLQVLAVMVPAGLLLGWLFWGSSDWVRLVLNVCVLSTVGLWTSVRYAFPRHLIDEVSRKMPMPLQRAAVLIVGFIRTPGPL